MMLNDSKNVSVIIPAYNAEKTIRQCVMSALRQTRKPAEIIIYDDCSTDGTRDVLKELTDFDPVVKVLFGEQNVGAGVARTQLLQAAQGDFVAFLDSDDSWHETKLEKQIAYMEDRSLDICVCSYEIIDEAGTKIGTRVPPQKITRFNMHLADWIPTSMTVIRNGLNSAKKMPDIRRRQDYAFWLILFRDNPGLTCSSVDEVLGTYLRSSNSLSSSALTNVKYNFVMFRSVMKYSVLLSFLCLLANIVTRIART